VHVYEHKGNIFNTSSEPVSLSQSLFYFPLPRLQMAQFEDSQSSLKHSSSLGGLNKKKTVQASELLDHRSIFSADQR
jgi:hypothetical protein